MICDFAPTYATNHPCRAKWWVVRLDTGDGRRVCGIHILAAAKAIGEMDNGGQPGGWHFEPLASPQPTHIPKEEPKMLKFKDLKVGETFTFTNGTRSEKTSRSRCMDLDTGLYHTPPQLCEVTRATPVP